MALRGSIIRIIKIINCYINETFDLSKRNFLDNLYDKDYLKLDREINLINIYIYFIDYN